MRRRKHKGLQLVPVDRSEPAEGGGEAALDRSDRASALGDPESDLYKLQLQHLLEQAVDALPGVYRAAFVLREIEHLSIAETAQALSIEEATVRTRVYRARRLLQQQLTDELGMALDGIYHFAGDRCDRIIARVFSRLDAIMP
jgi:RNA polymerase sigma-70 factor, ECF subfamily